MRKDSESPEALLKNFPPGPLKKATRLLNLRQVQEEFGLTLYAIYKAVDEDKLHAVQVDGKGRVYYAEWEVRAILMVLFGLGAAA